MSSMKNRMAAYERLRDSERLSQANRFRDSLEAELQRLEGGLTRRPQGAGIVVPSSTEGKEYLTRLGAAVVALANVLMGERVK